MKRSLFCIAILGVLLAAPSREQVWSLSGGGLKVASRLDSFPLASLREADLNGDGHLETVQLVDGRAELRQGGQTLWSSPENWQVQEAWLADLNRDGLLELALLVWRPWQPWPVDKVLPFGGRIASFQNAAGQSCHLILIGWRGQSFGERWAGSALADPLTAIAAADLDGDGWDELAALEGSYRDAPGSPADALTIWSWNGFGFTLIDRQGGRFHHLNLENQNQKVLLVTTP